MSGHEEMHSLENQTDNNTSDSHPPVPLDEEDTDPHYSQRGSDGLEGVVGRLFHEILELGDDTDDVPLKFLPEHEGGHSQDMPKQLVEQSLLHVDCKISDKFVPIAGDDVVDDKSDTNIGQGGESHAVPVLREGVEEKSVHSPVEDQHAVHKGEIYGCFDGVGGVSFHQREEDFIGREFVFAEGGQILHEPVCGLGEGLL